MKRLGLWLIISCIFVIIVFAYQQRSPMNEHDLRYPSAVLQSQSQEEPRTLTYTLIVSDTYDSIVRYYDTYFLERHIPVDHTECEGNTCIYATLSHYPPIIIPFVNDRVYIVEDVSIIIPHTQDMPLKVVVFWRRFVTNPPQAEDPRYYPGLPMP